MKQTLALVKFFFQLLSQIAPKQAAKLAFNLFQTPKTNNIKHKEQVFYDKESVKTLQSEFGVIHYYEEGDPANELVLLIHGWESNAGSMSAIGSALAEAGYHVVSLDLPAHGLSKEKRMNPKSSGDHVIRLLRLLDPQRPFSVVAHSLGSMVAAYTLSHTNYPINQIIYLTAPLSMESIFVEYKSMIGLNDKAYNEMVNLGNKLLNDSIQNVNTSKRTMQIQYQQVHFIHDRFDKMLSFSNSKNMTAELPRAELHAFEKIGHYRMLWNDEVIALICQIMKKNTLKSTEISKTSDLHSA